MMSKTKAFICLALLMVVIVVLIFVTTFIEAKYNVPLYRFITSWITGMYLGDKLFDFYKWLRTDK